MPKRKGGAYGKGRQHAWSAPRSPAAPHRGQKTPDSLGIKFLPPPCRTLADMTAAEVAAIEAAYGAKVLSRAKL